MEFTQTTESALKATSITAAHFKEVGIDPNRLDMLQFNNIRQFSAYIKSIKDVETSRKSSHEGTMKFTGTETFDDALDLVMKPFGKPPVKIMEAVENIEMKIRNNLHKKGLLTDWLAEDYHYDVEGVEIDIGKLVEGDPECYLKPNKKYKDHFYDLNVNVAVSWNNSTETIIEAFCKVIAVVISLEKCGYKIRLFATSITKNASTEGRSSMVNVCIKNYDELTNIKAIARIIYPSYLRRLIFKIEEVKYQGKLDIGYGQAVNSLKGCVTLDKSLNEEKLLNEIVAKYIAN